MLENSFLKTEPQFTKGINQDRISGFLVLLKSKNMTKMRIVRLAETHVEDELSNSFCFLPSLQKSHLDKIQAHFISAMQL